MLLSSSLCQYIGSHSLLNMLFNVCGRWAIDMNHITELFNCVYAWNWQFCPKWTPHGTTSINTFVSKREKKHKLDEREVTAIFLCTFTTSIELVFIFFSFFSSSWHHNYVISIKISNHVSDTPQSVCPCFMWLFPFCLHQFKLNKCAMCICRAKNDIHNHRSNELLC